MTPAELAAALVILGWSARHLAELLGCTRVLVGQWLSGRTSIPPAVAIWLRALTQAYEQHPAPADWRRRVA